MFLICARSRGCGEHGLRRKSAPARHCGLGPLGGLRNDPPAWPEERYGQCIRPPAVTRAPRIRCMIAIARARGDRMNIRLLGLVCVAILSLARPATADDALARIKTIVVIYAENRSFDHLYGFFPGANGIANAAAEEKTQLDHDGTPLPYLTIFGGDGKPDPRFPRLPNEPFRIDAPPINIGLNQIGPSPIHAFYHQQEQINGGRNNMFAAMST